MRCDAIWSLPRLGTSDLKEESRRLNRRNANVVTCSSRNDGHARMTEEQRLWLGNSDRGTMVEGRWCRKTSQEKRLCRYMDTIFS